MVSHAVEEVLVALALLVVFVINFKENIAKKLIKLFLQTIQPIQKMKEPPLSLSH